jgi:hypothetical protein
MRSLYPNARMEQSRGLVMFQHFFVWVLPSRSIVALSDCRMGSTSSGVWKGSSRALLICSTSFSAVIASSCSRNNRRALLGTTLSSCRIQKGMPGGGGIRVVHRMAEGSS